MVVMLTRDVYSLKFCDCHSRRHGILVWEENNHPTDALRYDLQVGSAIRFDVLSSLFTVSRTRMWECITV